MIKMPKKPGSSFVCNVLSYHQMPLRVRHWAFNLSLARVTRSGITKTQQLVYGHRSAQ